MSFKKLIMENLDKSKITKIDIIDFDGTLIDTQLPETGKVIWKEKTGNDWPHVGWWGRVESLDMDVFEQKPAPSIVAALNAGNANESTLTVLLTGRRKKDNIMAAVKKILDANNLKLDRHLFNYGGDTGDNKIEQMGNLLKEFPNVKTMEMWDDRDEHIPKFKAWGESIEGLDFIMNHVISANHNWD
jgi:hypothetical protein